MLFTAVIIILFSILTYYVSKQEAKTILEKNIENTVASSKQLSIIIGNSIKDGVTPVESQLSIQNALLSTVNNTTYHSVCDWSGKIIAHPEVIKIDGIADYYNTQSLGMDKSISVGELFDDQNQLDADQVINMISIENTDWIIISHLKANYFKQIKRELLFNNLTLYTIVSLSLVILMFIVLRYLKFIYQKKLEENQLLFNDGVSNLSKLNKSLENYQSSMIEEIVKVKHEVTNNPVEQNPIKQGVNNELVEETKSRILTYVRNELLSIAIEDIAYIYVDNTITYFVRIDGKRSTSNESLDQIYSSLDTRFFFKANRQFIVAISSIEKISKYGNSQLKLLVKPASELEIVIGKNKAASFKKWLNT